MTEKKQDEYFTFDQMSKRFPIFSEGALRWHRMKNTNNFNKCTRKIGRRIIISLIDFQEWMDNLTEVKKDLNK